jgi:hypothetical protein
MENLFILILFFALAILFFSIVSSQNSELKEYKVRTLLYLVITGLLIGAGGFLSLKDLGIRSDTLLYSLLLVWMLLTGSLHVLIWIKILPWASKSKFGSGLLFSFSNALLGGVFLLLAFHFSEYQSLILIHLTSLLLFLLPFLLYSTIIFYVKIPVKVLRKWFYPVDRHIEDPLDREMEAPHIVAFDFKKKAADENLTSFRVKAPKEMVFGKLFYYFINDYNDRNPDEKIEYLDENKRPYGWIFYFKPKWFSSIRYLDPEETNSFNFIKENSIIICKRVIEK